MTDETEQPYLVTQRIVTDRSYNPAYGDDRICECGHSYYRHFDPYEDMDNVGCKYCRCHDFVEGVSQVGTPCTIEGCGGVLDVEAERPQRLEDLVCSVCRKQHHGFQRGLNHPDWLDEYRAEREGNGR